MDEFKKAKNQVRSVIIDLYCAGYSTNDISEKLKIEFQFVSDVCQNHVSNSIKERKHWLEINGWNWVLRK